MDPDAATAIFHLLSRQFKICFLKKEELNKVGRTSPCICEEGIFEYTGENEAFLKEFHCQSGGSSIWLWSQSFFSHKSIKLGLIF